MNFLRCGLMGAILKSRLTHTTRQQSQRKLSTAVEYRVFPASLIRLTVGRHPNLCPDGSGRVRGLDDVAIVSDDGLVRPKVGSQASYISNGAMFRPNTHSMQELIRMMVDQYIDDEDPGLPEEIPIVFTVAKGTEVPHTLTLLREESTRFSMQPREPLTLSALNDVLLEFHRKHSKEQTADEWLDRHEYGDAFADDESEAWMAV